MINKHKIILISRFWSFVIFRILEGIDILQNMITLKRRSDNQIKCDREERIEIAQNIIQCSLYYFNFFLIQRILQPYKEYYSITLVIITVYWMLQTSLFLSQVVLFICLLQIMIKKGKTWSLEYYKLVGKFNQVIRFPKLAETIFVVC